MWGCGRLAFLTQTLDDNVTALAVDGSFDDCQALVKSCFADVALCDLDPQLSSYLRKSQHDRLPLRGRNDSRMNRPFQQFAAGRSQHDDIALVGFGRRV